MFGDAYSHRMIQRYNKVYAFTGSQCESGHMVSIALSRTGIGRHRVITATIAITVNIFFSLRNTGPNSSTMPMFQNSQHTDAHGSTFNDVGRDQINVDRVAIGQIVHHNSAGAIQCYSRVFCSQISRNTQP